MARTIGGNPLRNLAIRQGNVKAFDAETRRTNHKPTDLSAAGPRLYTDEDRRRLLAPIGIQSFGGKSWGGSTRFRDDVKTSRGAAGGDDRYSYVADRADLDRTE